MIFVTFMFFDNDLFQNDLKKLCYVFFAAVGLIESESEARGKRRPASGPIVFKTICIFIYICICIFWPIVFKPIWISVKAQMCQN